MNNNKTNGEEEKVEDQEEKKKILSPSTASSNPNIENDTVVTSEKKTESETTIVEDQQLKTEINKDDPTPIVTIQQDQTHVKQTSHHDSLPTTTNTMKSHDDKKVKEEESPMDKVEAKEVSSPSGRIRVGICAMDKKAKSKPMVSPLVTVCFIISLFFFLEFLTRTKIIIHCTFRFVFPYY